MSEVVSLYDAKTHLSQLVERAALGEEITITKNGRAMVRMVAIPFADKPKRVPAGALGITDLPDDFDDPLPEEIQAVFGGRSPDEFF
jgi:prevent-host-death family protein